jgi:hypothetical protein
MANAKDFRQSRRETIKTLSVKSERIPSWEGGRHPQTMAEMTGRNRALNAARNGKKKTLLRKKRLGDGKLFSRLTAHANG